jgi:MoaA/NifB/PqqE/SkfB family radical SAM enzyme
MRQKYFLPEQHSFLRQLYCRWIERREPVPDFPRNIQIQTRPGCPSRCVFCPNARTTTKIPNVTMPMALFRRIVDECLDHPVERISPYLMCEPLLDREIGDKIAYATRRRDQVGSKAVVKINSNGFLLDERNAKALLDSGLDRISFSVHGIVAEIYEQTMVGLQLDRVLKNIDRFLELKRSGNYKKPRVRVTMVKTKYLEPQLPEIFRYWGERDVKVNVRGLENRANPNVHESMQKFNTRGWEKFSWCRRMFEQVYIVSTGEMVLCCVDWNRKAVMGRIGDGVAISDVWNGPVYAEMRRRFQAGDLKGTLCADCLKEAIDEDQQE